MYEIEKELFLKGLKRQVDSDAFYLDLNLWDSALSRCQEDQVLLGIYLNFVNLASSEVSFKHSVFDSVTI